MVGRYRTLLPPGELIHRAAIPTLDPRVLLLPSPTSARYLLFCTATLAAERLPTTYISTVYAFSLYLYTAPFFPLPAGGQGRAGQAGKSRRQVTAARHTPHTPPRTPCTTRTPSPTTTHHPTTPCPPRLPAPCPLITSPSTHLWGSCLAASQHSAAGSLRLKD